MRGRAGQRTQDHRKHAFYVCQYVIVPETQHAVSPGLQMLHAALVVIRLIRRLAAIPFDDQQRFGAGEIGDLVIDVVLAAELVAGQLAVAQVVPELLFGVGHVLAQLSRPIHVLAFHP